MTGPGARQHPLLVVTTATLEFSCCSSSAGSGGRGACAPHASGVYEDQGQEAAPSAQSGPYGSGVGGATAQAAVVLLEHDRLGLLALERADLSAQQQSVESGPSLQNSEAGSDCRYVT